ncbi:CASP-like protein 4A2 [Ananas comosus]|uniref:CASP-like protein n=1 Tax=Ananas comosus TaxID=4615 RepID=A0A6P5FXI3_ANACO|nr:CASP-like protein 4A2 [Ananas comosus]
MDNAEISVHCHFNGFFKEEGDIVNYVGGSCWLAFISGELSKLIDIVDDDDVRNIWRLYKIHAYLMELYAVSNLVERNVPTCDPDDIDEVLTDERLELLINSRSGDASTSISQPTNFEIFHFHFVSRISNGGAHELPPPIAAPGGRAPPPRASSAADADADAEPHHPDLSSAAPRGGGDRAPRRAPRPAAAAAAASRRRRRLVRVDRWPRRRGGAPAVAVAVAGAVAARAAAALLCLLAFSVLAADRRKGWALDSYSNYSQFRYCVAVNVIGFLYAGFQVSSQVMQMKKGKPVIGRPAGHYFDFAMDQVLAYLLISASSSATARVGDWVSNWGTDPFPSMANGSIAVSFLAFLAFALSSLISAYNLFCPDL